MKEWLDNNWTGVLGYLQTTNSTIMTLIAMGQFEGLLSKDGIRWLGIIGILLGGSTVVRGQSNAAKVKVATAMQDAINATPGESLPSTVSSVVKPVN